MRLQCYAINLLANEAIQDANIDLTELCKSELRQTVYTETEKLYPFGIVRYGNTKIIVNCHYKFTQDVTRIIASQYTTGHWLKYLHARRAGVLSNLTPHSQKLSGTPTQ